MEITLYWMNDYLMVMYEVERARRSGQDHRKEGPSQTKTRRLHVASADANEP